MKRSELKLAAHMLRLAAEKFSQNGCNDFDLEEHMNCFDGKDFVEEAMPDRDVNYSNWSGMMPDWLIMETLARKLDNEP